LKNDKVIDFLTSPLLYFAAPGRTKSSDLRLYSRPRYCTKQRKHIGLVPTYYAVVHLAMCIQHLLISSFSRKSTIILIGVVRAAPLGVRCAVGWFPARHKLTFARDMRGYLTPGNLVKTVCLELFYKPTF